jgi:hypothetical protein
MNSNRLVAPELDLDDQVIDLARCVTLADLLECPASASDAISLISNFTKYVGRYIADMEPEDEKLELVCHRINHALTADQRGAAFAHLSSRNAERRGARG